jgi:hypothetical protein
MSDLDLDSEYLSGDITALFFLQIIHIHRGTKNKCPRGRSSFAYLERSSEFILDSMFGCCSVHAWRDGRLQQIQVLSQTKITIVRVLVFATKRFSPNMRDLGFDSIDHLFVFNPATLVPIDLMIVVFNSWAGEFDFDWNDHLLAPRPSLLRFVVWVGEGMS